MIQNNNNNKDNYGRIDFKKDHIGLGNASNHCASFPCSGEGNLTINKISGDKYLQYNDTYLNNCLGNYH
jgi:hypothetical protein